MKRLLLVFVVAMVATVAFGRGQSPPGEVTLVATRSETREWIVDEWESRTGGTVAWVEPDLSTGADITMSSMVAAGDPPDVIVEFLGRVGKYATPEFAAELDSVMDLSHFYDSALLTVGEHVYGLMEPYGVQGFMVNTSITEEVGYTVPDNWTTDDFLELCELVKSTDKYCTGLFAANQSGDYLYMNWFGAFGAELYGDGYGHTTINSPAGVKAATFLQNLVQNGYAPPDSAVLTDDDYVAAMGSGEYAAGAMFVGWPQIFQNATDSVGAYTWEFHPFPRNPGIDHSPAAGQGGAYTVYKDAAEGSIGLLEFWVSAEAQAYQFAHDPGASGWFPTRDDVHVRPPSADWSAVQQIVANGGVMDLGAALPVFGELRVQWFPIGQKLYNGELTPEQAMAEYEAGLNEVLGR